MFDSLRDFLVHWASLTVALWLAAQLFRGIRYENFSVLLAAALLLGIANTFVKPVLIFLTFPLSVLTLGLFLLVINGLMLLLVAALVRGFHVSGLWSAVGISLFVSIFSFLVNYALDSASPAFQPLPALPPLMQGHGTWI